MRKFNPEQELNKIRKDNKKKVILIICALLVVGILGYSFALYQVRHTQNLAFNTVEEFKKRDIILSVMVDGKTQNDFPNQGDGYVFDNIQCDKPGIKASFNNDTWELTLTTKTTNKCTVKFITKPYMDESGANYPDLFQGLIPIRYDNNKIYIADYKEKWYDYNNNEWANAVLIDHTNPEVMKKFYTDGKLNVNTEITTDDILQMYVWIPRYKYQLFNVNNEGKPKQLINIKFENTIETTGEVSCTYTNMKNGTILEDCKNAKNGNWYTHPAFTFGDTELKGIWVGKFETSDPNVANGRKNSRIEEITILPNKTSVVEKSISTAFNATRNIELQKADKYNLNANEIDTHILKNIEWGAIAYLTQSIYGIYKDENTCNIAGMTKDDCEVWINNTAQGAGGEANLKNRHGGTYTGCVGESIGAAVKWNTDDDGSPAKCDADKVWNTTNGVKASTTGNIYGIYDIAGGATEYVMGVTVDQNDGSVNVASSKFLLDTLPETKYYDLYSFSADGYTHERGHLGDATRETLQTFGDRNGGWNQDQSTFPVGIVTNNCSWFERGGNHSGTIYSGIFSFYWAPGEEHWYKSFRAVLTAQ